MTWHINPEQMRLIAEAANMFSPYERHQFMIAIGKVVDDVRFSDDGFRNALDRVIRGFKPVDATDEVVIQINRSTHNETST